MCLLVPIVQPAAGKELLVQPALNITFANSYTTCPYHDPISSAAVSAISTAIENFGARYDSTWRPAILGILTNNSGSLNEAWIGNFGVSSSEDFVLGHFQNPGVAAFVSSSKGTYQRALDPSDPPVKALLDSRLQLYVTFGMTGFYLPDSFIQNLTMSTADEYVATFDRFTPQLENVVSTQLPDKALGSLVIEVLDKNVVHVTVFGACGGGPEYSQYFGSAESLAIRPSGENITVTSTSTKTPTAISATRVAVSIGSASAPFNYLPGIGLLAAGAALGVLILASERKRSGVMK